MKTIILRNVFLLILFSLFFTNMYGQRVIKNGIYSETWLAENHIKVTCSSAPNEICYIEDVESDGQRVHYLFHQDKAIEKVYLKNASQPFKKDKQYINIDGVDYEIISSSFQDNFDLSENQKRNGQSKEYMDFEGKTYEVERRE